MTAPYREGQEGTSLRRNDVVRGSKQGLHGVGEHVYNQSPTRYQVSNDKSTGSAQHVGLTYGFRWRWTLEQVGLCRAKPTH